MKVQTHNSLQPPLEYNQDQKPLTNQVTYDLFIQLVNYKDIMQFQISSRMENR